MIISREDANDIKRMHNKVLKKVLNNALEVHISNLKVVQDMNKIRWNQGVINTLEETIDLLNN
jgi:hypothetical protein